MRKKKIYEKRISIYAVGPVSEDWLSLLELKRRMTEKETEEEVVSQKHRLRGMLRNKGRIPNKKEQELVEVRGDAIN